MVGTSFFAVAASLAVLVDLCIATCPTTGGPYYLYNTILGSSPAGVPLVGNYSVAEFVSSGSHAYNVFSALHISQATQYDFYLNKTSKACQLTLAKPPAGIAANDIQALVWFPKDYPGTTIDYFPFIIMSPPQIEYNAANNLAALNWSVDANRQLSASVSNGSAVWPYVYANAGGKMLTSAIKFYKTVDSNITLVPVNQK